MTTPALLFLLALAASPQERPVPQAILQQPTANLARAFSAPDAEAILWHDVKSADRMGPPLPQGVSFHGTARFFYAATSSATGVCRREVAEIPIAQRGDDVQVRGPVQRRIELGAPRPVRPMSASVLPLSRRRISNRRRFFFRG